MLNYGKWTQDMIEEAYDVVMKRGGEKCEKGIFHWLSKEDFSIGDGQIYLNQGDTDYDLIKSGKLYSTPYTNKKYKVGKSFKIIKHPQQQINLFRSIFVLCIHKFYYATSSFDILEQRLLYQMLTF